MNKVVFILAFSLISSLVSGQAKKILPDNPVAFKIKNAGIKVDGSFTGLKGTLFFNSKELSNAYFDVTIDAATINTGTSARDTHLKKAEYFDVEKYSKISFKSKKIDATKTGYAATGTLSIKGKSKEITIPFTYQEKNNEGVFNGNFTINRLDFGVGESSWILSDEVSILLNIKVVNQ